MQRKNALHNIMVVEALSLFLGNQLSCVLTAELGVTLYTGEVGRWVGCLGTKEEAYEKLWIWVREQTNVDEQTHCGECLEQTPSSGKRCR